MSELQVNATFPNITPDAVDEFKQVAAEALATIRGEPGTLQHDWFFSGDGAQCIVREAYASSDAFSPTSAPQGHSLRASSSSAVVSSWTCSASRQRRSAPR
jgi:hypothetical protein